MRERLAAGAGERVEPADFGEFLLGEVLGLEKTRVARGAGVGRDAVEIAVGELALRERGKDDAADAFLREDVEEAVFRPAVEEVVARLVDEAGRAELAEDGGGARSLRGV